MANMGQALYSEGAKEMLYYHVGLVESYLKDEVNEECVFHVSKLDEIRMNADDWHDSFFNELESLGNCQGGYPSHCKNYSVFLGINELPYSEDKKRISTWPP
jgi:hypothetical protein